MIWTVGEVLNVGPSILWTLLGTGVFIYLLWKLFGGGIEKSEERLEKRARRNEARIEADEQVAQSRRMKARKSIVGVEAGFREVTSNLRPLNAEIQAFVKDKTPAHTAEIKVLLTQNKERTAKLIENMLLVVDTLKSELKVEKVVFTDLKDENSKLKKEIRSFGRHFSKVKGEANLQANVTARKDVSLSLFALNEKILKTSDSLVLAEEAHISKVEEMLKSVREKLKKVARVKGMDELRMFFTELEVWMVDAERVYVPQTEALLEQIEKGGAMQLAAISKKKSMFDKIDALQQEYQRLVAQKQATDARKKAEEKAAVEAAVAAAK